MSSDKLTLYSYWRSSAAYRVRLALAWKGLAHDVIPVDLRADGHAAPDYLRHNPQGLLPALVVGDETLSQSLAIIEYLEEVHPESPLLPADAIGRARVRAAAQVVACDIHPVNNLRILRYLKSVFGQEQAEIDRWARHWIGSGLTTLERFAAQHGGRFLYGDSLSLADLCLLPQLYNARRVSSDLSEFVALRRIETNICALPMLASAHPAAQPDSD